MNGVEALVGIWMQNTGLRNPVKQWVETVSSHLGALTAMDQNAPPQSAYAHGILRLSSSKKFSNIVTCTERLSSGADSEIENTTKRLPSGARSRFDDPI